MPKAYLIAHIRVHDPEKFEEFKAMSGPAIQQYGGRVLVRNPAPDHREGDLRGLSIVIEFDDMDGARQFYESQEYTAARLVREMAAETDLMLVDGV
ncbi:DUF1330 domain-containing protein [Falsiruegeria mediterranea]|jgi:uncharacterized protein (DUF1330 family)|uniref:DUF1330 domain-containing protein n=1 Tax=Falsiruegeria mediterranea M17 TaxID=1200281 RepID=A0A2R8CBB2_9RHOB|nr:DUF1330 domain-containing protein [Falsiruegeria mediterranea]SPJ29656.1 hypothetical protein TRM7615_03177 [Falsiruegeria mediterranea M17]